MSTKETAEKKQFIYSNATYKLTPEEQEMQDKHGKFHRELQRYFIKLHKHPDPDRKVGIMLSGGVDSTTILWDMLDLGFRPHVFTFKLDTMDKLSRDARKAISLAEHYGLEYTVVNVPYDPDRLVSHIIDTYQRDSFGMNRRPDFEVITLWEFIADKVVEEGVVDLFSGIGDGGIHQVGRKESIRGRSGEYPTPEVDLYRQVAAFNSQSIRLQREMQRRGINLILPLTYISFANVYYNVPWHVMNVPRDKAITILQYQKEELETIKAVPSPMQCGDTGSREYFDNSVRESVVAREFLGHAPTSAIVLYNALNKLDGDGRDSGYNTEWFNHVTSGEDYKPSKFEEIKVDDDGLLIFEEADDNELFGDILDDDVDKSERRVDCFGNAFNLGEDVAFTNCPRAIAGLCGKKPTPENPYKMSQCEFFAYNAQYQVDAARDFGNYLDEWHSQRSGEAADIIEKIHQKIIENDAVPATLAEIM